MSTSVLPFTPSINNVHLNTINGVLGNASQTRISECASPQQQVQAHLEYVLNIVSINFKQKQLFWNLIPFFQLASNQFAPSHLNSAQQQERSKCIDILHAYKDLGLFPHQFEVSKISSLCLRLTIGSTQIHPQLIDRASKTMQTMYALWAIWLKRRQEWNSLIRSIARSNSLTSATWTCLWSNNGKSSMDLA